MKPSLHELRKELQRIGDRLEMIDAIADDASTADAYVRGWSADQKARSLSKEASRYLQKIDRRGFSAPGILGSVSREVVRLLGSLGVLRHVVPHPKTWAIDRAAIAQIRRVLAERSVLADALLTAQGLSCQALPWRESEHLQITYLPAAARGRTVAGLVLSRDGEMTVQKTASGYCLDGTARFVLNAGIADWYVVLTGEQAFVIEARQPGLSTSMPIQLLSPRPMADLSFQGLSIPSSHELGLGEMGRPSITQAVRLFEETSQAAAIGMVARAVRTLGRQENTEEIRSLQESVDRLDERIFAQSPNELPSEPTPEHLVDRVISILGRQALIRGNPVERVFRGLKMLRTFGY